MHTFVAAASEGVSHSDLITFFLSVALLIGVARILGEIAQKCGQPSILGELTAGLILGPSCLGQIAPGLKEQLFPTSGNVHIGLQFMSSLAIALFLLIAGMEINLRSVLKHGKNAMAISFGGMLIPFGLGLAVAFGAPGLLKMYEIENPLAFSLFFATALSITALPVIARILMDLKLIKSHLGVTVLTAAIVNDLIGWLIFAMVLGMIGASGSAHSLTFTMSATLLFAGFMFTAGAKIIQKIYPWIQANLSWPAGPLSFIVCGGLLCAAFTEWLGIHAIFGTFIFGVAVGQCPDIRAKTLHTLESFISFIITPIFFASIGLEVNFFTSFDLQVVFVVLAIGTIGKIGGSYLGGKIAGVQHKENLAIGCAMNARGVMEIILGLIAYQVGLINEALFVALVVLALLTSMTSGTLVQRILKRRTPVKLADLLKRGDFVINQDAKTREELIYSLSAVAAKKLKIDPSIIAQPALEREEQFSTGLDNAVAIPHCRIENLKAPMLVMANVPHGVNFFAPDESISKVVFLIITDKKDIQSQLEIIAQIATIFNDKAHSQFFSECQHKTSAIAYINSNEEKEH